MTRRALLVAVLVPALAGCGGKKDPEGAPPGPDRADVKMVLEGRPGATNQWTRRVRVERGDELALRVRLRNAGRQETSTARVRLVLPSGLKVERATVSERAVEAPSLGDPIDIDALRSREGFEVGPLGAYSNEVITFATRVEDPGNVSARLQTDDGLVGGTLSIDVR